MYTKFLRVLVKFKRNFSGHCSGDGSGSGVGSGHCY